MSSLLTQVKRYQMKYHIPNEETINKLHFQGLPPV